MTTSSYSNQTPIAARLILPVHFLGLIAILVFSIRCADGPNTLPSQMFIQGLEATLIAVYSTVFGLVFAGSIFFLTFFEMRREHLVSRLGGSDPLTGAVTEVLVQRWKDIANSFIKLWMSMSATYAFIVLAAFFCYLSVAFAGSLPPSILYYFVNYSMALVIGDVILLVLFFFFAKPFHRSK